MTKDALVGADATLFKGSVAQTVVASGTVTTAGAFYKIFNITGNTVFPAGYAVGDIFMGDGAKVLTPANSAYLITATEMADVNEFSIAFKSDEIEVTVLSSGVKKYRKGKTDMSGSVKGINTITSMKATGSVLNRFLRTATTTSGYVTSTLNAVDGSDLFGVFYLQKDASTAGEFQSMMIAQIELYGYNLGAAVANAQSWDSGIRLIGNDPIVYFRPNS